MAYASSSSPFASVKGQNVFSSRPSPPPFSANPTTTSPFSPFSASLGEPSSQAPTAAKRTGFEAFAVSSSPFTAASRSKSPVLGSSKLSRNKSPPRRANHGNASAFSAYVGGGVHSFAIPVQKRQRAGSPSGGSSRSSLERNPTVSAFGSNGGVDSGAEDDGDDRPVSFGEKLRAGNDDEDQRSDEEQSKFMLTEQECGSATFCRAILDTHAVAAMTGEEDEDTVHQVRGKLFSLSDGNQWKERGTGTLKLNVRRDDGSHARLGWFSLSPAHHVLMRASSDAERSSIHSPSECPSLSWNALCARAGPSLSQIQCYRGRRNHTL
jgi:Ran GTPase-activating protein (Ran-binding protein)